jgi:hypothetical protein
MRECVQLGVIWAWGGLFDGVEWKWLRVLQPLLPFLEMRRVQNWTEDFSRL